MKKSDDQKSQRSITSYSGKKSGRWYFICPVLIVLLILVVLVWNKSDISVIRGQNDSQKNVQTRALKAKYNLITAETTEDGVYVEMVGRNLLYDAGVKMTADSVEGGKKSSFQPNCVRDGLTTDHGKRWSSENDWENNDHWLCADFVKPVTIGLVEIIWERDNATTYAIEYSKDGKEWTVAKQLTDKPATTRQKIYLEQPVTARYVRLHVTDVRKEEEDLTLYYQNVSVLEMAVYEAVLDAFTIKAPEISDADQRWLVSSEHVGDFVDTDTNSAYSADDTKNNDADSVSRIPYPTVPDGYTLRFANADYENLIRDDGRIATTIGDTEVELGFYLEKDGESFELPALKTLIPASKQYVQKLLGEGLGDDTALVKDSQSLRADLYAFPETVWCENSILVQPSIEVSVETPASQDTQNSQDIQASKNIQTTQLQKTAEFFQQKISDTAARFTSTSDSSLQIRLSLADSEVMTQNASLADDETHTDNQSTVDGENGMASLGEEGYQLVIGRNQDQQGRIEITANTVWGLRYGCQTVCRLIEQCGGELQTGIIRDYPRYSVRGFGIDVARRPVSMDLLYKILYTMSEHKMNRLQIHLNDNSIIALNESAQSREDAFSMYSAYRLESSMKNADGQGITAEDYSYSKEEFMQFIETAAMYGVHVVPEIDTPAHSMAFTKVFPNLALGKKANTSDQLDVSSVKTLIFAKNLWGEYLTDTFAECDTVHLGMDEYYGDAKNYVRYLNELSNYASSNGEGKQIVVWGSLSGIGADYSSVNRNIVMQIWDTAWADPEQMVADGFSVINSLSCSLYIIPGGGYDRLDVEYLQNSWQPYRFDTAERIYEIPSWSRQVKGACYMLWNDFSESVASGYSDEEIFERFEEPLPFIAEKLW